MYSFSHAVKDRAVLCFVYTLYGAGSFSVAAHEIWNCLLPALRMCISPDAFRHHLKTHYFSGSSRPSTPLKAFLLAPQIRLLLTIVRVYKLYLLTYYLFTHLQLRTMIYFIIHDICV